LFNLLENQITPLYYAKPDGRLPLAWIQSMRESIRTIVPLFNTHRMVQEYSRFLYEKAAAAHAIMESDHFHHTRELSHWKHSIVSRWSDVQILEYHLAQTEHKDDFFVGEEVSVTVSVKLGSINPEHVRVQTYFGALENNIIVHPKIQDMTHSALLSEGVYRYSGIIPAAESGAYGVNIRVIPMHPHLFQAHELALITWAF